MDDAVTDNGDAEEPAWTGPTWDDPALVRLAERLREAHGLVAALPPAPRRRLSRHLLAITDLAKRDPDLAARRLDAFLADFPPGRHGNLETSPPSVR